MKKIKINGCFKFRGQEPYPPPPPSPLAHPPPDPITPLLGVIGAVRPHAASLTLPGTQVVLQ